MEKQKSNNPNGRPKGAVNKLTKELRTALKNVVADELEKIPELFEKLEPKDRLELLIKMLSYTLPKITPVTQSVDEPFDTDDPFGLDFG